MKEYIDREAAMKACVEAKIIGAPEWNIGAEEAKERIEALPAADVVERPRWIPVTERLPEDGSDVLAYLDSRITAANYYKETWQDCVMGRLYLTEEGVVTHWMPIPEPPKEDT